MPKKPKIISRHLAQKVAKGEHRDVHLWSPPRRPGRKQTEAERLYWVIDRIFSKGYRFTDNEFGIPWLRPEEIEDKGEGIFVIRFRCPEASVYGHRHLDAVEEVCAAVKSECRFFVSHKQEVIGKVSLPYAECFWILNCGELEN